MIIFMLLKSLIFLNSFVISYVDILYKKISLASIILMFILCILFQIKTGFCDSVAIFMTLLFAYLLSKFLPEGDLALLLVVSVNMTLEKLSIFIFLLSLISFFYFLIGRVFSLNLMPFAPAILISHFLILNI